MIEARQARALEMGYPAFDLVESLRSWLSSLRGLFGSWNSEEGDEDPYGTADPELVAALQYVASLVKDQPRQ